MCCVGNENETCDGHATPPNHCIPPSNARIGRWGAGNDITESVWKRPWKALIFILFYQFNQPPRAAQVEFLTKEGPKQQSPKFWKVMRFFGWMGQKKVLQSMKVVWWMG
jgi:hypothetical protein